MSMTAEQRKSWADMMDRALLGVVAVGTMILLGMIIHKGGDGWDVAAFLLVLQSVLSAVSRSQSQHSIDRATDKLGESQPIPMLPSPEQLPDLPETAKDAAAEVADAAADKRDEILERDTP